MNTSRAYRFSYPALAVVIWLTLFPTVGLGQESAAYGSDMWIGFIKSKSLFVPHKNFCDPTAEAFVEVGPLADGFCIEKTERAAETWDEARQTCTEIHKRLPEPAEFKQACLQASTLGLNDMKDDREWASNFSTTVYYSSTSHGLGAPIVGGSNSCYDGSWASVACGGCTSPSVVPFRCVR